MKESKGLQSRELGGQIPSTSGFSGLPSASLGDFGCVGAQSF
jgi:hypothetical protein